jgi:small subunit ribosomal protein S16
MVKIRLTRTGKRNHATYRLGAFDSRTRRDGRSIEILGNYDPHVADKAARAKFDVERIKYWLSVGAQPSDKVGVLLREAGVEIPKPKKRKRKPAKTGDGKTKAPAAKPAKK